ncbi:MAG: hypothetical protein QXV01_08050, partial [Candidatus Bathyarchaeia archaeon]
MVRAKVEKIVLDDHGSYLGMEKGCFIVKDANGNLKHIPLFENEIGEILITSGNFISTSVLASCGFWYIPVVVLTRSHKPVA